MAPRKKKTDAAVAADPAKVNAYIAGAGTVVEQPIVETLEKNYMPYAMSVIISRAIPEIDGFKPSHRKLLFTMHQKGLLNGDRIKSANIVGATMQYNPHGDQAIYDTMVRMTTGNETLLHPFVESKGSFGKAYSRDMRCAAPRYTEAKLAPIAAELFRDIDSDTVDFVDNYDATLKEPTLFPVTFPTVLVNINKGIAVGMASNICSFNLTEVCETEIAYLNDPECDLSETLLAPDFAGGGQLLYRKEELDEIYRTGVGSFRVRAVYSYDKSQNCIDVTQIPPTTTSEQIIEKIIELVKAKKLTEINDVRNETDLKGLKITIDLKRGVDPDALMRRLFRSTPLEDSFPCNFNLLVGGAPYVMGVREILDEWSAFRTECVRRRFCYDLQKATDRLHLLKGLSKILLDIDKAIQIIRQTEEEREVVPNLMIGFGIDQVQAEYVAEIKLRHLNREYILKRLADIEELEKKIAEYEDVLSSKRKIHKVIIAELRDVIAKYGQPRKTEIVYDAEAATEPIEAEVADYPVTLFFTREGYFKKITPQSLRMSGEHKLKEGDEIVQTVETHNTAKLLFFTNRCQVYKSAVAEFDDTKASVLGDFVASKLEMEPEELPRYMAVLDDYKGFMLFFMENGRVAKVELTAYETKANRRKLVKACCDKYPIVAFACEKEECEYLMTATGGRRLLLSTALLAVKTTKDTQGVMVMTQKRGQRL
ncbi:MAG: topoisomerase IV, partial [Clostridia bacterium]|nr:topoisomerase IV [Clostridia bacterium]